MTVAELVTCFPEIPEDLRDEPLLAQFADKFHDLLRVAQNPGARHEHYSAEHFYYLKLIGPFKVYRYGLSSRQEVMRHMVALLERHAADPENFAATLLPDDSSENEGGGPGGKRED